MKNIITVLPAVIMLCVFMLSGCVSAPESPYAQTAESIAGNVTDESGEMTDDPNGERNHPISSVGFIREMIEETNRLDEQAEQMGYHPLRSILFMGFTEDNEPYSRISTGILPLDGNSLRATVAMRIEEAEIDGSYDFSTAAVMLLNGQPVDFEMNGKASKGGVLTFSLRSNQDYIMSVSAEDLPIVTGENELMLVVFNYCEARDLYIDAQSVSGHFVSDRDYNGAAAAVCPENEIDIDTIREKADMGQFAEMRFVPVGEMLDFQADHYGNYLMTTKPEPTMHFYIENMNDPDTAGSRKGIMFLFIDGELQPVWNGKYFGSISVQDSDILKVIRIGSSFQPGQQPHVYWYYQETQSAADWPASQSFRMKMNIMPNS